MTQLNISNDVAMEVILQTLFTAKMLTDVNVNKCKLSFSICFGKMFLISKH